MKIKTAADLKRAVEDKGSCFFSRDSMKFFGDTMKNYYVPVEQGVARKFRIQTVLEDIHTCYALERRNPVKENSQKTAYFDCETFQVVPGEVV